MDRQCPAASKLILASLADCDTLIFLSGGTDAPDLGISDDDEDEIDEVVPAAGATDSETAADDDDATPASSNRPSPIGQDQVDRKASFSRTRNVADAGAFHGRRIASCRSRPTFSGGQPSLAVAIQDRPGYTPGPTMGGTHTMTPRDGYGLPLAGMHDQMSSTMLTRFGNEADASDMMPVVAHGGHSGSALHMPWSAILPDMGPDPPADMFGMPPTMAQPTMRHGFFHQQTPDLTADIQNGLHPPSAGTIQYESFVDTTRRSLVFRGPELQQMPAPEVNMDMMGAHYYGLRDPNRDHAFPPPRT
jgi:hypothetical protein